MELTDMRHLRFERSRFWQDPLQDAMRERLLLEFPPALPDLRVASPPDIPRRAGTPVRWRAKKFTREQL